jgi:lipid-A-disaccharide synthase
LRVEVIREDIYSQIKAADAVMAASGTATLETALLGTPMVVLYRVSPLTYFAGKCLINVKCISLVNIIAGRIIVPELIQDDMNPQKIAVEVSSILEDPHRAEQIRADLKEVRNKLGGPGASERAARIACGLLS